MESKANLAKAVINVMKTVKGIDKTMVIGSGNSSYKGIPDQEVKKIIGKAMIDNGLCILPIGIEPKITIERWDETTNYNNIPQVKSKQSVFTEATTKYLLIHESGESQEIVGYGHGIDSQDKGAGKATTYALKYALLYLFLVPTGKIDDADETHSNEIETPNKTQSLIDALISKINLAQSVEDLKTIKQENVALYAHTIVVETAKKKYESLTYIINPKLEIKQEEVKPEIAPEVVEEVKIQPAVMPNESFDKEPNEKQSEEYLLAVEKYTELFNKAPHGRMTLATLQKEIQARELAIENENSTEEVEILATAQELISDSEKDKDDFIASLETKDDFDECMDELKTNTWESGQKFIEWAKASGEKLEDHPKLGEFKIACNKYYTEKF